MTSITNYQVIGQFNRNLKIIH